MEDRTELLNIRLWHFLTTIFWSFSQNPRNFGVSSTIKYTTAPERASEDRIEINAKIMMNGCLGRHCNHDIKPFLLHLHGTNLVAHNWTKVFFYNFSVLWDEWNECNVKFVKLHLYRWLKGKLSIFLSIKPRTDRRLFGNCTYSSLFFKLPLWTLNYPAFSSIIETYNIILLFLIFEAWGIKPKYFQNLRTICIKYMFTVQMNNPV